MSPRPTPLWDHLSSFQGLALAAQRALRGKRSRPAACAFHGQLERELLALESELGDGTYRPGAYRTFEIRDPKLRLISAAPFRDRVVHHALVAAIEPLFERRFIHHSYACRTGRGTHAALRQFARWSAGCPTMLKVDVRKYFPSIDHDILKALVRRTVREAPLVALVDLVIDASPPQEPARFYFPGDDLFTPDHRRRGIPIGNLTSQFLANVYLDPIDHLVTDRLRFGRYLRYMDDMVVFHPSKAALTELLPAIRDALASLRLRAHEGKSRVHRLDEGVPFLGFVHRPASRRLAPTAVRRMRRRAAQLRAGYARGDLALAAVRAVLQAWVAHARSGDTDGLVRAVLGATHLRRGSHDRHHAVRDRRPSLLHARLDRHPREA